MVAPCVTDKSTFVNKSKLCLDKITSIQQKLLLLTKAILSIQNSKMLHLANGHAMCNTNVLVLDKSYFCPTKVTFLLFSTTVTSVLAKVASVNKRMDVTNGTPYNYTSTV